MPADRPESADPKLTDTLREVLRLLKRGDTNKDIARIRGVSEQAVKRHVSALLRRFAVERRVELINLLHERELRDVREHVAEDEKPRAPERSGRGETLQ
jgi:DNA-binding NarL/FixJ family response regulator